MIFVGPKLIVVPLHEEINFVYLYTQNDKWVNEKLLLKVDPLSWKIVMEKEYSIVEIYIG